ncbi:Site-specific recombinase resolvase [Gammaproteobacteria bacterium]
MNLTTLVPLTFKRRGVRCLVDTGAPAHDPCLLIALGRAWHWQDLIDKGVVSNGADIARREELHPTTVNKILRLTLLAPDLVEQLMEGSQPKRLSLTWLQHHKLPADWNEQRVLLESLEP